MQEAKVLKGIYFIKSIKTEQHVNNANKERVIIYSMYLYILLQQVWGDFREGITINKELFEICASKSTETLNQLSKKMVTDFLLRLLID